MHCHSGSPALTGRLQCRAGRCPGTDKAQAPGRGLCGLQASLQCGPARRPGPRQSPASVARPGLPEPSSFEFKCFDSVTIVIRPPRRLGCAVSSAKCPLRILAKNQDFVGESLRKSICESLRILAKACETMNCESLRKLAKYCESVFANLLEVCESRRVTSVKACESIFAKPC